MPLTEEEKARLALYKDRGQDVIARYLAGERAGDRARQEKLIGKEPRQPKVVPQEPAPAPEPIPEEPELAPEEPPQRERPPVRSGEELLADMQRRMEAGEFDHEVKQPESPEELESVPEEPELPPEKVAALEGHAQVLGPDFGAEVAASNSEEPPQEGEGLTAEGLNPEDTKNPFDGEGVVYRIIFKEQFYNFPHAFTDKVLDVRFREGGDTFSFKTSRQGELVEELREGTYELDVISPSNIYETYVLKISKDDAMPDAYDASKLSFAVHLKRKKITVFIDLVSEGEPISEQHLSSVTLALHEQGITKAVENKFKLVQHSVARRLMYMLEMPKEMKAELIINGGLYRQTRHKFTVDNVNGQIVEVELGPSTVPPNTHPGQGPLDPHISMPRMAERKDPGEPDPIPDQERLTLEARERRKKPGKAVRLLRRFGIGDDPEN